MEEGLIFDIQRYAVNDGPGIRTTVFLKGCPLRCTWCANPESWKPFPQLLFFESLCTRCYRCVGKCPSGATSISSKGLIEIDRERCEACGACVKACLGEARVISGKYMTVDEVVDIVMKDSLLYRNSGGGVTVSGGESTYQPKFLLELLIRCKEYGIDTALDTCGYVTWEVLEAILEYVDLVLFDIKHIDPVRHKELTGVSNKTILKNATRIAEKGTPMIVRVPLIPGYNDSLADIEALGEFLSGLAPLRVDLSPYHQFGENKYQRLGCEYKLAGIKPPDDASVQAIKEVLESYELQVLIA